MSSINIDSVEWNYTELNSNGIVRRVKTNLKHASFKCKCGAEWTLMNDSRNISADVNAVCPDCGVQRVFARSEYASM